MKSGLFARVDESLLQRFKQFVLDKYGKLHGTWSVEIQQAMAHWLNEQGLAAHTQTRINPGQPQTQNKIDTIILWLKGMGIVNQFSMREWNMACVNTVGSDGRTVKKYLRLAKQLGRVKHYAGAVWEIV